MSPAIKAINLWMRKEAVPRIFSAWVLLFIGILILAHVFQQLQFWNNDALVFFSMFFFPPIFALFVIYILTLIEYYFRRRKNRNG